MPILGKGGDGGVAVCNSRRLKRLSKKVADDHYLRSLCAHLELRHMSEKFRVRPVVGKTIFRCICVQGIYCIILLAHLVVVRFGDVCLLVYNI